MEAGMRGSQQRQMIDSYRHLRDSIQDLLDSGRPLELPSADPGVQPDFQQQLFTPEAAALIASAPPGEDRQQLMRTWLESRIAALSKNIAEAEREIGVDDDGDEVFESDDPAPGLVELPDAVGHAAEAGDIAAVMAWLGPTPVPVARVNARWMSKMQRTLLHEACYEGHMELISLLLECATPPRHPNVFAPLLLTARCCSQQRRRPQHRQPVRHDTPLPIVHEQDKWRRGSGDGRRFAAPAPPRCAH